MRTPWRFRHAKLGKWVPGADEAPREAFPRLLTEYCTQQPHLPARFAVQWSTSCADNQTAGSSGDIDWRGQFEMIGGNPRAVFMLSLDVLAKYVRDLVLGLGESDVRNVYQMVRRDADQMLRSHPGKGTPAFSVLYLRPAHEVDPEDGFGDYQGYTVRPNKREKACVLTLTTARLRCCVVVFFDLSDVFLALRRTRTQRGNVRHSRGTATVSL